MKVSFLFGSGADTDACSLLKSGQSFSEALLDNRYKDKIKTLTNIETSHFRLLYSTSTKVFVQTIINHMDIARGVFGQNLIDDFKNYYMGENDIDFSEKIKPFCEKWADGLIHGKKSEAADFFLKNAVFFDSLDEKFNSLRDIKLCSNSKRVINAYFTVFLLMFESLYEITESFEWTYKTIFEKLNMSYDISCSTENYYKILAESNIECSIATTNYTDVIRTETGKEDIVYLHGKLTWFESLSSLSVYDCTKSNDREDLENKIGPETIIPFIMIPSGVKPLICRKQIKEFNSFIDNLEQSQYLVIVGYRFNSEDNHINSIIAEWLTGQNRKLIYLNFDGDTDLSFFKRCNIDINNRLDDMKDIKGLNYKIFNIAIDKHNGRTVFKDVLEFLKENT